MIGFFPILLKQEPLYGGLSRLAHYLGPAISYKQLNKTLFGDYNMRSTIDLPSHLKNLELNIKNLTSYTAQNIIDNHTLLPFYSPFLVNSKRSNLIASMLGENGSTIHTRLGINASRIRRAKYPRFCPICLGESYEKFGEAHWQLLHQIPSNNVCLRHKCYLQEYEPDINEINGCLYIHANQALIKHHPIQYSINYLEHKLTKIIENILNQKTRFDINEIDYLTLIKESDYQNGDKLKKDKLQSDFVKFYEESSLIKIIPVTKSSFEWVTDIIKRPTHYFDPIRHILITEFLKSIKKEIKKKESPFGSGPWVCYNKVCEQYLKKSIADVETHIERKSNRLIGHFKCACGMVYTRSFIEMSRGRTKEFIRVKERGDLWTDRLMDEIKLGKSLREIGRVLGTDAKTVKTLSEKITIDSNICGEQSRELNKNRSIWEKILVKSNYPKVKSARKENPRIYSWLYRNDKIWLTSINAKYSFKSASQLRIDWGLRDKEFAGKLSATRSNLIESEFRGRMTKSLFSRMVSKESKIEKNLSKLPITNQLLIDFSENQVEYHLRKTRLAIKDMLLAGKRLNYSAVIRAAGIKTKFATPLRSEIQKLILNAVSPH